MISSNALYLFLLVQYKNIVCKKYIRSIQELMSSEINCKHVCRYFPYLAILTKSATSGEVQVNLCHTTIGNNSLGGTVTVFSLTGSTEFLAVVSINTDNAFDRSGNNLRLTITEVLLCATTVDIAQYKNLCSWVTLNSVLLLPFLTKSVVPDIQVSATELLKTFSSNITDHQM